MAISQAEQRYLLGQEHGKIPQTSLAERYTQFVQGAETTQSEQLEAMLRAIDEHMLSQNPKMVFIESSPLYAIPHAERHSQAIDSPAALGSFYATQKIDEIVRGHCGDVQHWVMIDDVHNGADTLGEEKVMQGFGQIQQDIPILNTATEIFLESVFRENQQGECSTLDARFQHAKMQHAHANSKGNMMIIVVHPEDFKKQQGLMITELFKIMKNDQQLQGIPNKKKQEMSIQPFIHVWVDAQGNITEVTKPIWREGHIIHEPVTHS